MESPLLFSKRENEVLDKLFKGFSTREIALELQISEFTVRAHRRKIMEKAACKNCAQLYAFLLNHNLFSIV